MRLELRPASGGAEAVAFTLALADAITAHTGTPANADGRNTTFHRL